MRSPTVMPLLPLLLLASAMVMAVSAIHPPAEPRRDGAVEVRYIPPAR